MTLIKKLILSEFLKVLTFTFIAFFSIFFIIDFIEKIDDFMENKASVRVIVAYFLYKIPFAATQIMPIAVLMATIVSLSQLNKNGEITALKASGNNLIDSLTPLMAAGLIVSLALLFVDEVITPSTERLSSEIERNWIKKTSKVKQEGSFTKSGYWIKTANTIIKIKSIREGNKSLRGVTIYPLSGSLSGSIIIKELNWDGEAWKPSGKIKTSIKTFDISSILSEIGIPTILGATSKKSYKDMTYFELKDYIDALKKDGHNTNTYKIELYSKLSFPFVNFIMVLIGMSFGLKSGRDSGLTLGIAIAFLIGFSYWIIFGISISLGISGLLPPLISAFFTDILFLAIGVLMLGYIRR